MLKLLLAPQAIKDLEDIFEYTAEKWTISQAEIYQDLLMASMNKILSSPSIGTGYNYNKLKSGKHLLFYRILDEYCIVVRVLHERMDWDLHLF